MINPEDLSVVIAGEETGHVHAVRIALKAAGVRELRYGKTPAEVVAAFAEVEPDVMVTLVGSPDPRETGLSMIRFIRRWEKSPNRFIPIVAASMRRDPQTVRAVINSGGHEYVALPAPSDLILKKVLNSIFVGWQFVDHPSYVGPCRRRRVDPGFAGPERRSNWTASEMSRQAREDKVGAMMTAAQPAPQAAASP
jgi:two-component system, chemotaxis family, chemotaxis protein CheY